VKESRKAERIKKAIVKIGLFMIKGLVLVNYKKDTRTANSRTMSLPRRTNTKKRPSENGWPWEY
jgi:hypothetical protein